MQVRERVVRFTVLTLVLVFVQFQWQVVPVSASSTPSATITEWTLPIADSNPYGVAVYDGKVYFTEHNEIGCLDPLTNTFTEWTVPTIDGDLGLRCIAVYEGKVWFTEYYADKIGRLDPSTGTFTEWNLSGPGWSGPYSIAVYKGKVYFTESEGTEKGKRIGCLDPSKNKITEWNCTPLWEQSPWGMTIDEASGKVWFTRGPSEVQGKISMLEPPKNTFTEWTLPDQYPYPWHITFSDGRAWFTEYYGRNKIGRLDPTANLLTEWNVPTPVGGKSWPYDIIKDAMGNIFFTEYAGNEIGKLEKSGSTRVISSRNITKVTVTPGTYASSPKSTYVAPTTNTVGPASSTVSSKVSGNFTEWGIPTVDSEPTGIFTEDGTTFYFTEWLGNKIAQIIPQYTFKEWSLPNGGGPTSTGGQSHPTYITTIWFTEYSNNRIGRLDSSTNKITEWTIPTTDSAPCSIAISNGSWFTEHRGNKIGRLDPSTKTFTEWTIPTASSSPLGISVSSGKVWFTEADGNKIGRLDPSTNTFTEWTIPTSSGAPSSIIVYGGKVWFTECDTNKIGKLYPIGGSVTKVTPVSDTVSPTVTTQTPTTTVVKLTVTTVTPTKTYVTGLIAGPFTEWPIPTTDSHPSGVAPPGGGEVWFIEKSGNKIGLLS